MSKFVVTIAREYGSGGKTIGKMLADKLKIKYYDKDLIKIASEQSGINESFFNLCDEKINGAFAFFRKGGAYKGEVIPPDSADFVSTENLFNLQAKVIEQLADTESCIIVGRCADYILKDRSNIIKVFIYANHTASVKNIMDMYGVDEAKAAKMIEKTNKARKDYYRFHTGHDWYDAKNYDICLDSSRLCYEQCVEIIEDYLKVLKKSDINI